MNQCIGSCSICGGEVMGHVGAWGGIVPPPPAQCSRCGATEARGPVIQMIPRQTGIPRPSQTGIPGPTGIPARDGYEGFDEGF